MKQSIVYISAKKIFVVIITLMLLPGPATAQRQVDKEGILIDTLEFITGKGENLLTFELWKGPSWKHPTFAIWIEDLDGNYLETVFVTRSIATGIYQHADGGNGTWKDEPGESIRPAALPYWAHKRGVISRDSLYVPTPENPVTDAMTGPTPDQNFVLTTDRFKLTAKKFRLLLEINQPWDWNDYWINNKFPGHPDYLTSAQPSVIYTVEVDVKDDGEQFLLQPVGHGHPYGDDGTLNRDLSTLTSALEIISEIKFTINQLQK